MRATVIITVIVSDGVSTVSPTSFRTVLPGSVHHLFFSMKKLSLQGKGFSVGSQGIPGKFPVPF